MVMLVEKGNLALDSLAGQTAVVTGAGRGIGFEAARSLIRLGAKVVIAEIDKATGREAERDLNTEFGAASALFVQTDVGREQDVERLKRKAFQAYAKVDIVLNNATFTPMGAVHNVPIQQWDASYRVNLRGPALLAGAFLPGMLERDYGVFVCVSSVGEAFMGAYESFKAAQVHLANTLDAELEGTSVHVFSIGPGLVRTPGAAAGIEQLAPLYGKTVEEFYAISEAHILSAEAAGAGFAAAIALASQFRGQEISSKQALLAAGIELGEAELQGAEGRLLPEEMAAALVLCRQVRQTLEEQSAGWLERSLFERQWMLRDFKKSAGMPVEQWLESLSKLETALVQQDPAALAKSKPPLGKLAHYYAHMQELARGYEKNPAKLAEQLQIVQGWQGETEQLDSMLSS